MLFQILFFVFRCVIDGTVTIATIVFMISVVVANIPEGLLPTVTVSAYIIYFSLRFLFIYLFIFLLTCAVVFFTLFLLCFPLSKCMCIFLFLVLLFANSCCVSFCIIFIISHVHANFV